RCGGRGGAASVSPLATPGRERSPHTQARRSRRGSTFALSVSVGSVRSSIARKEVAVEVPLVQITYRDMDPTPGMEAAIRDKIDHLLRYHPRIQRCHVVVEAPHQS